MHKKNFGAIGTMAPTPLSLKTRGGGGGGLGGCRIQGLGPAAPPPPPPCANQSKQTKINLKPCPKHFLNTHDMDCAK